MTQDQTQLWEAVKDIGDLRFPLSRGKLVMSTYILSVMAKAIMALHEEAQQQPAPETSAGWQLTDETKRQMALNQGSPSRMPTPQVTNAPEPKTSAGECRCYPPLEGNWEQMDTKGPWHQEACPMYGSATPAASETSSPDTTGPTMKPSESPDASRGLMSELSRLTEVILARSRLTLFTEAEWGVISACSLMLRSISGLLTPSTETMPDGGHGLAEQTTENTAESSPAAQSSECAHEWEIQWESPKHWGVENRVCKKCRTSGWFTSTPVQDAASTTKS